MVTDASPRRIFPLWGNDAMFRLLQPAPCLRHWRLRNLAQLARRLCAAESAHDSPAFFLRTHPVDSTSQLLHVALVAQLMCNVWCIQDVRQRILNPAPPPTDSF